MSLYYSPGRYRCRVAAQAMSITKKDEPQFVLTFDVVGKHDPTTPDTIQPVKPGQRSVFRVINENTIEYFVKDLQHLGFDKATFGALDPASPNHHSFVGQEIDAECEHENWEGKDRERWQLARGGGSLNLKPADNKALRKLDSLFGAKLKQIAPTATKAAVTKQEANAEAEEGVEAIPF